jgi:hypothetical protein
MRTAGLLAMAGFALCLLTGCIPQHPIQHLNDPAHPQSVRPESEFLDPGVQALCPAIDAVHLDGYSALPEGVYLCAVLDGPREVAYRIGDPLTLLTAYAAPDANRSAEPCLGYLADPLILWIHGGGTIRAVYAPVDGCGFPQKAASDAYLNADRDLVAEAVEQ